MKTDENPARIVREYFFKRGPPNLKKDPYVSKEGVRVVMHYMETTLEDGLPNLEAWQAARKSPHYNKNVENLLEKENYLLAHSDRNSPEKISREITRYLKLVRKSYQGQITHAEIMEELAHSFKNARTSPTFRVRTEAERSADPSKGIIEDIPGNPITLEQIASTVQEDLGTSLINDFLKQKDNFNADVYANQRGFSSGSRLYNTLRQDQREQFKETMKNVYESKTRAGEKVNVSEFCRKAGVSTSTFYRYIREKEGSMEEFKEKIRTETEEDFKIIKLKPPTTIRRRVAAAALIGLSVIVPQLINSDKSNYLPAQISQNIQLEQPPQQNIELASL